MTNKVHGCLGDRLLVGVLAPVLSVVGDFIPSRTSAMGTSGVALPDLSSGAGVGADAGVGLGAEADAGAGTGAFKAGSALSSDVEASFSFASVRSRSLRSFFLFPFLLLFFSPI